MVHQFKFAGYNIVLDSISGSVHVVDDVAYDVISMFEKRDESEIKSALLSRYELDEEDIVECIEDVKALKAEGKLFKEDSFKPDESFFEKRRGVIKALCLHVAHTCNLNCEYCFAAQGKYHGERALMSFEVGKRALDFLVESSGSRRNLEVDFFGGEPLMNFDVVKKLVAYARSIEKDAGKRFRFTLTTNGMLIDDDVIDFANREMDNVVLSLDGRREVHDRFRKTLGGVGSYDLVVPKFQRLVKARSACEGKTYYIRGTYTHKNTDFLEDIKQMLALGFDELSLEPVVCDPKSEYALTKEDLPILFEQYERLALLMKERREQGKPFTFYHYMIDLSHGPCIYKRVLGCGSGTEYLAVTPTGELYPCHQFVGNKDFVVGDIWQGVTNHELVSRFARCNVYSKPECENCWAKLYCAGGCAANAFNATGDINGVYEYGCELFKKRIECAIFLKVAETLESETK